MFRIKNTVRKNVEVGNLFARNEAIATKNLAAEIFLHLSSTNYFFAIFN